MIETVRNKREKRVPKRLLDDVENCQRITLPPVPQGLKDSALIKKSSTKINYSDKENRVPAAVTKTNHKSIRSESQSSPEPSDYIRPQKKSKDDIEFELAGPSKNRLNVVDSEDDQALVPRTTASKRIRSESQSSERSRPGQKDYIRAQKKSTDDVEIDLAGPSKNRRNVDSEDDLALVPRTTASKRIRSESQSSERSRPGQSDYIRPQKKSKDDVGGRYSPVEDIDSEESTDSMRHGEHRDLLIYQSRSKHFRAKEITNEMKEDEFRAYVRKNIEYLKAVTRDTSATVFQILKNTEKKVQKNQEILPKDQLEGFEFPLGKYSDVTRLENELKNNAMRSSLVTFLGRSGGKSSSQMTNRMLNRLLTNKLGANTTWSGKSATSDKNKFKENVLLFSAICDAIRSDPNLSGTKDNDVQENIKDWLRHAGARAKAE